MAADTTIINGEVIVDRGELQHPALEERLGDHRRVATAMQAEL